MFVYQCMPAPILHRPTVAYCWPFSCHTRGVVIEVAQLLGFTLFYIFIYQCMPEPILHRDPASIPKCHLSTKDDLNMAWEAGYSLALSYNAIYYMRHL